jgi:hypothetical protein
MASPEKAAAIRQRAGQILQLGEYIGLFEWIAFGARKKFTVHILFGEHVVDIAALLATTLPARPHICRVVALDCSLDGVWKPAESDGMILPPVKHWVIGAELGSAAAVASGLGPWVDESVAGVGWRALPTDATGDCGIDTMAYYLGLPRTAASWSNIRAELADFYGRIADDPMWQEIFLNCGEAKEPEYDTEGDSAGSSLDGDDFGEQDWHSDDFDDEQDLPHPKPPPPPTPKAPPSCSGPGASPAASSLPASLSSLPAPLPGVSKTGGEAAPPSTVPPPPLPPPPAPPPLEEPLQPLVLRATAGGDPPPPADCAPIVEVGGSESFAAWLKQLSEPELRNITSSVEAYVEAESRWRATRPNVRISGKQPAKKKLAHSVNMKYAAGLSYKAWKAGPGRSSKAPLRDPGEAKG